VADDIETDMDLDAEIASKDEAAAPKGVEQAAPEKSSTSTDVSNTVEDDDLLSVAKDAVSNQVGESQKASSASPEEKPVREQAEPKPRDDENYSDVPFNKHPRFQEILKERNALRDDAGRYRNVETFLSNAGLSGEEAHDGLRLMGLAKTNPAQAFAEMRPWLQNLIRAAGEVLPADLEGLVREGRMDQAAALEVSRSRAQVSSMGAQRSFEQQRQAQLRAEAQAVAVQNSAQVWEQERQRADPNYGAKQPALMREVAYLQMQEGKPTDANAVRAMLDRAYQAVNAAFTPPAAQAPRKPITPIRGGQVAGHTQPAPRTTMDIIRQVKAASQG
jgi:hypothetical protein